MTKTDEEILAGVRTAEAIIEILKQTMAAGKGGISWLSTDHLLPLMAERFEWEAKFNEAICTRIIEDALQGIQLWESLEFVFAFGGLILDRMDTIKGRVRMLGVSPGDIPIPGPAK